MEDNQKLLDWLFAERKIALQRSDLFDTCPPALPPDLSWDRVEGMLLGLAIGDSLGNTTEGQLPDERNDDYGEIRDYLRDNDTIAAIVGAVVGALHGCSRLPRRWIDGLPGRTAEADDGRVFELIAAARAIWP